MVSAVLGRHFGQDGLLGALVGFGGVFGAWSLLQQEEQEILDLPCKKIGFWEHGAEALGREFSEIVLSPQRRAHFCIVSFRPQRGDLRFTWQNTRSREPAAEALPRPISEIVLSPQRGAYFCIVRKDVIFK